MILLVIIIENHHFSATTQKADSLDIAFTQSVFKTIQ